MEPSAEQIADVLDRAHDELLVRGWCRRLYNTQGNICAIGALYCATGSDVTNWRAGNNWSELATRAHAALSETVGTADIPLWNDTAESIDDVLDAFRQTSKRLREEAGAS